jgi:hypothetical protein
MAFSSLAAVRDAEAPVDQLSEVQQAVPADLTPPEAETLTSVNRRFADAAPDIRGRLVGGPAFSERDPDIEDDS